MQHLRHTRAYARVKVHSPQVRMKNRNSVPNSTLAVVEGNIIIITIIILLKLAM